MKTKFSNTCQAAVCAALLAISLACAKTPNDAEVVSNVQGKLGTDSGLQNKQLTVQAAGNDGAQIDSLTDALDCDAGDPLNLSVGSLALDGSVSTFSSTSLSPRPSAVSRPTMPKAAWSNSSCFSCVACGAWSVAMQSIVPSASASMSASRSASVRSGGAHLVEVS